MIIKLSENFSVEEATEFNDKVRELIKKGNKEFVVNFEGCKFIDSTGLGVLVSTYKKCVELNGSIKLKSVNSDVSKIFKLTRLDKIFEIVQ